MSARKQKMTDFIAKTVLSMAKENGLAIEEVQTSENLLKTGLGVLDSIDFLNLILAVEKEFDIEVDFSDLDPAAFTSIEGLADCCAQNSTGGSGA